jgi:hypothetical protein
MAYLLIFVLLKILNCDINCIVILSDILLIRDAKYYNHHIETFFFLIENPKSIAILSVL